jgi:hypothetical protein
MVWHTASIPLTSRIYTKIYGFLYIYVGFTEFSVYLCLRYTGKEQDRPTFLDPNFPKSLFTLIRKSGLIPRGLPRLKQCNIYKIWY